MKRFWLRIAILAVLALSGQGLIGRLNLAGEGERPKQGTFEGRLGSSTEVLYFGDCVLGWTAEADRDRRGIPEMLQSLIPPRTVTGYPQPGADLDVADALVTQVARQAHRPRIIVIPINLRSLSPGWDRAPEYQFRSLKFRLRYGDFAADTFLAPLVALKIYPLNPYSLQDYADTPVFDGDVQIGTLRDFRSSSPQPAGERLRRAFVVNYGTRLPADHPKLDCLESITQRCRRAEILPVFYVTPIDLQSALETVGPGFQETVARNIQMIRDRLSKLGMPLLDLSTLLDPSGFDWRRSGTPNERLSEMGRRAVAQRVAGLLTP